MNTYTITPCFANKMFPTVNTQYAMSKISENEFKVNGEEWSIITMNGKYYYKHDAAFAWPVCFVNPIYNLEPEKPVKIENLVPSGVGKKNRIRHRIQVNMGKVLKYLNLKA